MFQKGILLAVFSLVAGCFFVVSAQDAPTVNTPAVPDNATPLTDNIKLRSVELDRIKREAEKTQVLRQENGKELNFSLIKDDFEGIQIKLEEIIKAYQPPDTHYDKISTHSNEITEMAVRLKGNVFEPKDESAKDDKASAQPEEFAGKPVRNLIIVLRDAIDRVARNPMWQNLQVIDPELSAKAEGDLDIVIKSSNALWIEAGKMKK